MNQAGGSCMLVDSNDLRVVEGGGVVVMIDFALSVAPNPKP